MTRRIVRSPDASKDLANIKSYIESRSGPGAADGLLAKIEDAFVKLADFPKMGPARPDFGPDLRSWPVRPYLVVYYPLSDGIVVARVIHGARNLPSALAEPP